MLTLFCAVVGQKGSAFSIKIDASESVDALKKAIKKEQMYEFASSKLQLFLAKKDNKWLNSSAVDALALDGDGYPEGLTRMNPLSLIKNPINFGERFEFKEFDIHVLVVVPEVDQESRKRTTTFDIACKYPFFKNIGSASECERWISFQENIPSTTLKNLYIRESYQTVEENIGPVIMSKKAIITGTPGIGKSLFLIYLLFKFVKERKRVLILYHPYNIYYDENGNVFEFNHGNFPPFYDHSFWNDSLWCLFDAKFKDEAQLGALPVGRCMFILSTSPRREMINDFRKPPIPQTYYMPTWTKGELEMIASFFPNVTAWHNRFKILGGIPRHIFECTEEEPTKMLEAACRACSLDDCVKIVGLNSTITEKSKVVHLLIHILSTSPYTKSSVDYASQTALDIIVREKGVEAKMNMLSLLQSCSGNPLTAALCGYIFEPYAIDLLEKGGTFKCRKMVHGNTKEKPIEEKLVIPSSMKTVVDKVLPDQPHNQLHVPKTSNYVAIDAWIPGIGAFQMTVGKKHTIRGGAKKDIEMITKDKNLYWLLPPMYYDSFTKKTDQEITEYAMKIPYPSVT